MPYNRKEADIRYREKNRLKIREQADKYYKNNKEKINNRRKDYVKIYNQKVKDNPNVIKSKLITKWTKRGIIDPDLSLVYDYSLTQTHCWICDKEYNNINHMDRRCLDHDHTLIDEPNIRYICCVGCNIHVIR